MLHTTKGPGELMQLFYICSIRDKSAYKEGRANKSQKPSCFNPTDLMFLSQDICWGIEVVHNHISAVYNMHNHAVAWKLPFISEGSVAFIQFSGADTEVSRLREGAEEIGLKHMALLEAIYSAELWSIPCPKSTLSGKFLSERIITVL